MNFASRLRAAGSVGLVVFAGGCAADLTAEPDSEIEVEGAATTSANGLSAINGLSAVNGLSAMNGLSAVNGLSAMNGLSSINGLSSTNGLMTTSDGRMTVKYLARCALTASQTLIKADQYGVKYSYPGAIGLAPEWLNGACDVNCQRKISACMLAHVNTSGISIPLWMVSPATAIGWGQSVQFPNREGTFFGNIFGANPKTGTVDAFFCNGPGFTTDTVPGRLGANQPGAPYSNPYAGSGGNCSPCTSTNADGPSACAANGITFDQPITVWRGQTFQAEATILNGGGQVIDCPSCGGGKRVGHLGATSTVAYKNVGSALAGRHDLIVYYTNGWIKPLSMAVKVNGGAAQVRTFAPTGAWEKPGTVILTVDGFKVGNNVVVFSPAGTDGSPDLDWMEVVR